MTVNVIKLCVGVDEVSQLREWQKKRADDAARRGESHIIQHVTRNTPRRAAEILDGGSLYWVIRRFIQVRQRITAIESVTREDGRSACALILDPELVETRAYPHRPFQGWRYLSVNDAPPDITGGSASADTLPSRMKAELHELGLL